MLRVATEPAHPSTNFRSLTNTFEITARGPQMWGSMNGSRTVDGVRDTRNPGGPVALQYGGGIVKFRKVQIVEI